MKVYPTDTKAHMIVDILPKITQDITLWLAGRISKHEYDLLESKVSHIVRLDVEIQKLNMKKSYKQVCALRGIRLLTENIMKSVQPAIGETEKSFEERIRTLVPAWYVVDFLSVAGYEAMKDATIGSAMDREIQAWDILCIDFGISNGVVHSDMTRCYQAWENGIYSDYLKIEEVIRNSLRFIKPGVSNKEYVHHLLSLSQQAWLQDCRFVDLGHGIGYDTHEYPDLYNDSFVFENGLCFTIEPEYKVWDRFIRFEDVYVLRDGECIPLSDFS
jgi:Xaa-Pro aminopeptidase